MNSISRPKRATPIASWMTPAMNVAISSPPSPNWIEIGCKMTTKAAVGPVTE